MKKKLAPGTLIGDYVVVQQCDGNSKVGVFYKNSQFVDYGSPGTSSEHMLRPTSRWDYITRQQIHSDARADTKDVLPNFQFEATFRMTSFWDSYRGASIVKLVDVKTGKSFDCSIAEFNPILNTFNNNPNAKQRVPKLVVNGFDITALWQFYSKGQFFGIVPVYA